MQLNQHVDSHALSLSFQSTHKIYLFKSFFFLCDFVSMLCLEYIFTQKILLFTVNVNMLYITFKDLQLIQHKL